MAQTPDGISAATSTPTTIEMLETARARKHLREAREAVREAYRVVIAEACEARHDFGLPWSEIAVLAFGPGTDEKIARRAFSEYLEAHVGGYLHTMLDVEESFYREAEAAAYGFRAS